MWKYISNYFVVWWHSVVALICSLLLYTLGITVFNIGFFVEGALLLVLLSFLTTIISTVVQLFKFKWLIFFTQLLLSCMLFVFFSFLSFYYPNDFYAESLNLPENVRLDVPIDFDGDANKEIEIQNLKLHNLKFLLANSGQSGIYSYYLWFKPKERGSIYLKAFEITGNDPLSAERLKEQSSVLVDTENLKLYSQEFTIYEGDWGQPYGARIEIWFKPRNGGKEYKLLQKNYKIEGWMR